MDVVHKFSASLKIDTPILRCILRKGGKTKEQIEKDTGTHLYVPRPHEVKRGSCLVVKGSSQDKVDEAISQIRSIFQEAAESPSLEYSHFISLPLALHPALVVQVTRFHDSVMDLIPKSNNDEDKSSSSRSTEKGEGNNAETTGFAMMENEQVVGLGQMDTEMLLDDSMEQNKEQYADCDNQETMKETKDDCGLSSLPLKSDYGIEESILIRPTTLHLTVLMLKLWSKERVAAAVEVLQGLNSKLLEALDYRSVTVRLKGVECMKGSPAKAHILYARVEDVDQENRLLCACKVIKEAFIEAGLVSERDKKQELKLHATLINSSHRKRKRGKRFGRRIPFDARAILSKHGSEEWGEYTITEAHLSERFVFGEDGYYHCCGSLKFPAL